MNVEKKWVQVVDNHILCQRHYYDAHGCSTEHLTTECLDPAGEARGCWSGFRSLGRSAHTVRRDEEVFERSRGCR